MTSLICPGPGRVDLPALGLIGVEGEPLEVPDGAVETEAAPVVDTVGGVGVLLDLEDEIAAVDGVDLAAADQDGVTDVDWEAVDAGFKRVVLQGGFEFGAGDAIFKADNEI